MSEHSSEIVDRFLEVYLEDSRRGRKRELRDYLELFPEDQAAIATEFLALGGDEAPTAEETGRLGRYRLIRKLGQGGQGTVWLAEQDHPRRSVALKVLNSPFPVSGELERFSREVQLTARFEHPGICPIYEVGQGARGTPFVAMRYVEGESLAELLHAEQLEDTTIPLEEAEEDGPQDEGARRPGAEQIRSMGGLIAEAARVLAVAHASGVVHRDIKPGNIMRDGEGRPVLLDFGIATALGENEHSLTGGGLLGSPPYMSPEQAIDPSDVDHRSDVWSLGVTLYQALTGERPFQGDSQSRLIRAITTKPHARASSLNPAISRDLSSVVDMALAKDPDRRYRNAEAFADDLEAALAGDPVSARPTAWTTLLRYWVKRNPKVAVVALLCLVVGAGLLGLFVQSKNHEVDQLQREQESEKELAQQLQALSGLMLRERYTDYLYPVSARRIPEVRAREHLGGGSRGVLHLREELARLRERAAPGSTRLLIDQAVRDLSKDRAARARVSRLKQIRDRLHEARQGGGNSDQNQVTEGLDAEAELLLDDILWDALKRGQEYRFWRFPTLAEQHRHDVLAEILTSVRREKEQRQRFVQKAREAERLSLEGGRDLWRRCLADIERDVRFRSCRWSAQDDLVPLGKDSESGLWEFWLPASGDRPRWCEDVPTWEGRSQSPLRNTGIILVLIPGGDLASEDARPSRPVAPFLLSKYELTVAQAERAGATPSIQELEDGDMPAVGFSMLEFQRVAQRLGCRFPTTSEWVYAARGDGDPTWPFISGATPESLQGWANLATTTHYETYKNAASWDDHYRLLSPVGGNRLPNSFGLLDVVGNVWELTVGRTQDGGSNAGRGQTRLVLKGGSYLCGTHKLATTAKAPIPAFMKGSLEVGVRLARSLTP